MMFAVLGECGLRWHTTKVVNHVPLSQHHTCGRYRFHSGDCICRTAFCRARDGTP